ncbi:MAG: glycoside hydrolase family 3 N-terminal domain-containing protein [Faecousia sp.]
MTNEECKAKAQALLNDMSVDEKVAQIGGIMYIQGLYERMAPFLKNGIGEISCLCTREMKTIEEVAAWQRQVQKDIMERSPHHIPAIFHIEGLCGSFTQGSTSIPSGVSRGSSFDTALEEKLGGMVARQELACGFTHILAPVLDVARDPRMGRCGESYGEDPTLVSAMGTAFAKGIQNERMNGKRADAVAKHFYGFHASSGGIHGANADLCDRDHLQTFGKPFQAAIAEANLRGVMPCYCAVNGEPFSLSRHYLTEILRDEMGFDGCVFSDYGGISNAHEYDHVGETMTEAGLLALEAGMDQELPFPQCFNAGDFAQSFKDGKADMTLLDQACLRVLTAKYRMGLFDDPFALDFEKIQQIYDEPENRELSLTSARESLVLLKNEQVLPISQNVRKIALIGCHANNARYFFGGYTHMDMATAQLAATNSMAGVGQSDKGDRPENILLPGTQVQDDEQAGFDAVLKLQKPGCRNLLEELKARMPDAQIAYAYGYPKYGTDTSGFRDALEIAKDADLILLTLGGKWGSGSICTMGEGIDTMDIGLPQCQEAFIAEVSKLGKPMVGLHFSGRPISSDIADEKLDAILECWCPSETGAEAIADILLGKVSPSGKLPVCVARNAGQIPVYYNQLFGSGTTQARSIGFTNYVDGSHSPRYYFGHGLSYASFDYSNLRLDKPECVPDEPIKISVDIQNTGSMEATEIPLLFLRDEWASMVRPNMELYGFCRVTLAPGEKKKVTFTLDPSQTAFLTKKREIEWKIEKGDFTVMVGAAADDIRLTASLRITQDRIIPGKDRKFWALTAES